MKTYTVTPFAKKKLAYMNDELPINLSLAHYNALRVSQQHNYYNYLIIHVTKLLSAIDDVVVGT